MSSGNSSSGSSSLLSQELIHIQMNAYDSYQDVTGSLDCSHGTSLPSRPFMNVPLIRVYGSLPSGHNILCHIHGIFPYVFIAYDGLEDDSIAKMYDRCSQLHSMLELAMKRSYNNKGGTKDDTFATPDNICETGHDGSLPARGKDQAGKSEQNLLKYIANVSVVKGLPFYGYHCNWAVYYKVSLLNPSYVTRFSDMLREGKISGQKLDVYESHIPYLLQFSADFNLFGCSWLKASKCFFRSPLLNQDDSYGLFLKTSELEEFLERFNKDNANTLNSQITRVGNSLLEIDILPQFIKNKDDIEFRNIHTSLVENNRGEDNHHKLFIPSTKELWNQMKSVRNHFDLGQYTHALKLDDSRNGKPQIWQNNDELLKFFQKAKQRTSTKPLGTSEESDIIQLNNKMKSLPFPSDALEELWPKELNLNFQSNNLEQVEPKDDAASSINLVKDGKDYSETSDTENEGDDHVINATVSPKSKGKEATQPLGSTLNDLSMTQAIARRKKSRKLSFSQIPLSIKKRKNTKSNFLGISTNVCSYRYKGFNLGFESILPDLEYEGFPALDYNDPFFSNSLDLKKKDYVYSGQAFNIRSFELPYRKPIELRNQPITLDTFANNEKNYSSWKYAVTPPTFSDVHEHVAAKKSFRSQVDFKTPSNEFGYKYKSNTSVRGLKPEGHNSLSHISLEVHINTRGTLLPDPKYDAVQLIFWKTDPNTFPIDIGISSEGILSFVTQGDDNKIHQIDEATGATPVAIYHTELEMFEGLVELIQVLDPDLISGFEIHSSSWGYIIERCDLIYDLEFCDEISRIRNKANNKRKDRWGYAHASGIQIPGRHVLNIWRLLRSDLNLLRYTVENITFQVLHKRLPHLSHQTLTNLWTATTDLTSMITVINYWKKRVGVNIDLLREREIVSQTVEQARLLGVDFYSVFSRGSQYKVESVLVRLCKSEHFMLPSPSKTQVRKQKALECIPLVMEPESSFYKSPLVVLDFQSLYPSIMIGYNYCYSTILGRVHELKLKGNQIGTTKINIPSNLLDVLDEQVTISPNGIIFVKENIRKSMLAKMLADILETRFMVKTTMNDLKDKNETMAKLLNNKQLALKLLANVTYGYASASFSGRMPCSDVADSIVQTGRETLEKAISFIEENPYWGAKVVYGDTDSLFVYLPGKSRKDAFRLGREMANEITKCNPRPVTLKFEKVYHPCILVSKKRYVGYSFDNEHQTVPKFDAKGIETVRRDGHPAQQKIVEKALRILFDDQDLSAVKTYVQDQFQKINRGQVSIQDFCFAREVKLGSYKSEKTAPPSAVVATKKKAIDHRAEPQYRERVSYVVVKGRPGQILRERCIPPEEFLSNDKYELDSNYYICKTLLPPLQRFFNLIGVDVSEWYNSMPKVQELVHYQAQDRGFPGFMRSTACINCRNEVKEKSHNSLCETCYHNKRDTTLNLLSEQLRKQSDLSKLLTVCRACCEPYTKNAMDRMDKVVTQCDSHDCPVYFSRIKYQCMMTDYRSQRVAETLKELDI